MYLPAIETRRVLHTHIHTYIQIKITSATVENALPVQVRCHRVPLLVSHILKKVRRLSARSKVNPALT